MINAYSAEARPVVIARSKTRRVFLDCPCQRSCASFVHVFRKCDTEMLARQEGKRTTGGSRASLNNRNLSDRVVEMQVQLQSKWQVIV